MEEMNKKEVDVTETESTEEIKKNVERMSVYKALTKKATLKKQIDEFKSANSRIIQFIQPVKKSSKTLTNGLDIAEYEDMVKSHHQKYQALLTNLKSLDIAIANFNATHKIDIAGQEMTVLAAIQRKTMIPFERSVLDKYKRDYIWATSAFEKQNADVEEKANNHVKTSLGEKGSKEENAANAIRKSYIDDNSFVLIDPLKILSYLEKTSKELDDFELNVNTALTEANASNEIDVEFVN